MYFDPAMLARYAQMLGGQQGATPQTMDFKYGRDETTPQTMDFRFGRDDQTRPQMLGLGAQPRRPMFDFTGQQPQQPRVPKVNFDVPQPEVEEPEPEPQPQSGAERYLAEYQRLQKSQSPMMQRYLRYLDEAPKREDYKPSLLRRIFGGMATVGTALGTGDMDQAAKVNDMANNYGYNQAYADYQRRGGALKEMADIEKEDTANQIKYLQASQAAGLNYDKYQETVRHNKELESAARDKQRDWVRINGQRNRKYWPLADGGIKEYDPETGRERIIPARTVEQARAEYQSGMLGVARKNAATASRRADIAGNNSNAYVAAQNAKRGKPPTPSAQLTAREVVLQEMARNRTFGKYVVADPAGNGFHIAAPDDNTAEYAAFSKEFKKRLQAVLEQGSGGIWMPDEDIEEIDPDEVDPEEIR